MKQIVRKGERFPSFNATNIHGANVSVPDQNQFIHLQFRRFAGCPICNLHLQSFVRRHNEIRDAGVREVVIFHSDDDELLPFQGSFPFDIIGDLKSAFIGSTAWKLRYSRSSIRLHGPR